MYIRWKLFIDYLEVRLLIDLDVLRPIEGTHPLSSYSTGFGVHECLICAAEKRYYRYTRRANFEIHFEKHNTGKNFSILKQLKSVSGNYYRGDWYIPDMFYSMRFDKIFKFTDTVFTEYTGKLDTTMIRSYQGYGIQDRHGVFLRLLPDSDISSGIINEGFIENFESYC